MSAHYRARARAGIMNSALGPVCMSPFQRPSDRLRGNSRQGRAGLKQQTNYHYYYYYYLEELGPGGQVHECKCT